MPTKDIDGSVILSKEEAKVALASLRQIYMKFGLWDEQVELAQKICWGLNLNMQKEIYVY